MYLEIFVGVVIYPGLRDLLAPLSASEMQQDEPGEPTTGTLAEHHVALLAR